MFKTTMLDFVPLWAVFFGSTILIVASIQIGFTIGRIRASRTKKGELPQIGGSVAATLGLLAFMMAFTFGSTTSRWDERKELVLDEANAIGTAYLRTDLLPEPQRSKVKQLLTEYLELRLGLAASTEKELRDVKNLVEFEKSVEAVIGEANRLQSVIWQEAMAAYQIYPTPGTGLFINAINDVFDVQQSRVTKAIDQRMPMVFWVTLYSLAALAMGLGGYDSGLIRGGKNLSPWVVALAFSAVLLLIVALDRPQTSAVNQAPLQELYKSIGTGA
jgi:hypothetical protein